MKSAFILVYRRFVQNCVEVDRTRWDEKIGSNSVFIGATYCFPIYTDKHRQSASVGPHCKPVRFWAITKHCFFYIFLYNLTQYSLLSWSPTLPLPWSLHASRITRLDIACTQVGPTRSLERMVAQHTYAHALTSSTALTTFPHPCVFMHWASLWSRPRHWHMKGSMRHCR